VSFNVISAKESSLIEERTMINLDKAANTAAIHPTNGSDGGHRNDDDLPAVGVGDLHCGDRSSVQISALVGERWKASVTRASIPAPFAATLMLRSAWSARGQTWMRPVRIYRAGGFPIGDRSMAEESGTVLHHYILRGDFRCVA